MIDTAKKQRKEYTEWLRQRKKSNGENYSENTVNSYASSLSSAPGKLTGITLKTTNLYEITSVEKFKKIRTLIEGAENFEEVNINAGNKAFQYALQYYEEFLVQQEQEDPSNTSPTVETKISEVDKNTILYGPPGTGKTYNTVAYAVAIIENTTLKTIQQEIDATGYESVLARYRTYKQNGQIAFTTFHQSYGYEEFIEGIKPKIETESTDQDGNNVSYEIKAGIFKQFCEKAQMPIIEDSNEYGIRKEPTIWKLSLGGARENSIKRDCLNHNRIRIGWDDYGENITKETDFSISGGENILSRFIEEMMIGDIVLVLYDEKTIDAIGVVTGEYEWLNHVEDYKRCRSVNWLAKDIRENIYELNGNKVMTLGAVYRLNRISLSDVLKILKKHNLSLSTAIKENVNNYVFIIDEINRGNISKIFGELITLIEPTKRIGQSEEIKLYLPYSQVEFGVPNNVYILATMNTADRSIARLDTALRRRFQFAEMMPNPQYLDDISIQGIDLSAMLTKMNRRIEVLYDREHAIGHAYFMSLTNNCSLDNLAHIFKNVIIPLLQEYFYEDYHLIQLVLGDNNKNRDEQFIHTKQIDVTELFGNTNKIDIDDEASYEINEQAFTNINAYRKIYSV
ncbi:5-methylcytosine-specific restriction protein B [Aneurinibacillus soli]|uniref:5-methylcytosine-specific restriction enzyme B n=1 Tax=Aneurinibacillus soli TaxID=1500254 RepID=A0A0U5B9K2_9BACL|nr:AAA family ATPase [Aneurinibacillus soli]PYE57912.1 5-methylcytosine-specific restriction protein B [Aneurinibacillus soli]BAU26903.1 5-methylcytosine-specific restriction enzyme B [Aneurinibacillus soli]